MAVISPFKAFHYNTHSIPNLSDVITPPYDVIPEGKDKMYWDRSPYNFAHVDLPHSVSEDYSRAATTLKKWREHSTIVYDPRPNYYLYRQAFNWARNPRSGHIDVRSTSVGLQRGHRPTA